MALEQAIYMVANVTDANKHPKNTGKKIDTLTLKERHINVNDTSRIQQHTLRGRA